MKTNPADEKNKAEMRTWKKLQEVQAGLADILSDITLFWRHFESNILYFCFSMGEDYGELRLDKGYLR